MSNMLKAQNVIAHTTSKEIKLSEQHQFLGTIFSHLNYLFQRILISKVEKQPQKVVQLSQRNQTIPISKNKKQESHLIDLPLEQNQQNLKMLDQDLDQGEEASDVPSIEEISNFDEEKSSEKSFKKKKVTKKKKGKNKMNKFYKYTKKPVSSFVYYYKDRLKMIKQQKAKNNESISIGNLAKIISKEWRQLSQKQKRPYVAKAELSIRTYYSEKEKISKKICSKQKKDTIKPLISPYDIEKSVESLSKGHLTSFFVYFKENSQRISREYGQHQRGRLAKIASDQWKKLSNIEKQRYQKPSQKEKIKIESKQEEKASQAQPIKRKRLKLQQQEYKPKIYRNKTFKTCQRSQKNAQEAQQSMKRQKQQGDFKELLSQNWQKSTENEIKLQENKILKQQMPEVNQKSDYEDRKSQMADIFQNHTVIQVDSDDQISNVFSEELESFNEESYNLNHLRKIDKNDGKKIRGPISPFLLYYQRIVKKLRMANSNAHGSELVRLASTKWGELPEAEKGFYQDLARKSREKYAQQVFRANVQGKGAIKRKKRGEQ